MKINLGLGIIIFCAITTLAILEDLSQFIDSASLIIVAGGALGFGISSAGSLFSDTRLEAISEGAVISGWLGLLIAIVMIAGNINIDDMSSLGPSIAVATLTVVYGYFVKVIIRMILLSRNDG